MIKLFRFNLIEIQTFRDYFARATADQDGLDQLGRMSAIASGQHTLLFQVLTKDIMSGISWIAVNPEDIRYFMEYHLPELPDRTQIDPELIRMPEISFIGVQMKNGDSFLCSMSELPKLEKLLDSMSES